MVIKHSYFGYASNVSLEVLVFFSFKRWIYFIKSDFYLKFFVEMPEIIKNSSKYEPRSQLAQL